MSVWWMESSDDHFMYCIRKKKILSLGSVENQKIVAEDLKKRVSSIGQTWAHDKVKWCWSPDKLFWHLLLDCNMNVKYQHPKKALL